MIDAALAWHDEHQQRGTTGEINFDIRSELTYLSQASDMLADLFAHTPLTDRHIKDLKQAVMEMGGNAIEWGHRKNADLVLRITYRIDPTSVTLDHQGPGARLQSPEPPARRLGRRPDRPHRDPQRAGTSRGGLRHHARQGPGRRVPLQQGRQRGHPGQTLRPGSQTERMTGGRPSRASD